MNEIDELGPQLRAEAERQKPPFSPALHERVLQSVRTTRARQSHRRWWTIAGVAAAAVIAVAVSLQHGGERQRIASHTARPDLSIRMDLGQIPDVLSSVRTVEIPDVTGNVSKLIDYLGKQVDVIPAIRGRGV